MIFKPTNKFSTILRTLLLLATGLFLYAIFLEPNWLEVRSIEIRTKKLKQTDFTIVQISDLHCDNKIRNEKKLTKIINKIQPDIIVFTGDSVNTKEALPVFKDTLSHLEAKLGKVAVRGNWDVWYWRDLDIFSSTGFSELKGDSKIFSKGGEKIALVGLNPDEQVDIDALFRPIPSEAYTLFLFHYPGINEEMGKAPVDLFLAGHTHGGQVRLPFYGALITLSKYGKKYEAGAYPLKDGSLLYVSRGIGMEGGTAPRVRFLSRPEITVFHIKPEK